MSDAHVHDVGVSHSESLKVEDFLICTTGRSDVGGDTYRNSLPVRHSNDYPPAPPAEFEIGRGVFVVELDYALAEGIMDACTPGLNFSPARQYGQRYSYRRRIQTEPAGEFPGFNWDTDNVIAECVQLSRLIIDNADSYEYAARRFTWQDGKVTVAPSSRHLGRAIYRVRNTRDWLTTAEAEELRELANKFWSDRDELPARVTRAMWRVEYASTQAFADVMVGDLVSAIESLLKTERHHATRQFGDRTIPLADELGIEGVTVEFAERMYEARSDWNHGNRVRLFAPEGDDPSAEEQKALSDVALLQDLARAAIRRSIEDDEFRARFDSDETVAKHWPLSK